MSSLILLLGTACYVMGIAGLVIAFGNREDDE